MSRGTLIYFFLFFMGVIFLAYYFHSGKKDYFPVKGEVIKIEKKDNYFNVIVKTDKNDVEIVLKFVPGKETNFTRRLFLFLGEGDTISVLVLEERGTERTVHYVLSVR